MSALLRESLFQIWRRFRALGISVGLHSLGLPTPAGDLGRIRALASVGSAKNRRAAARSSGIRWARQSSGSMVEIAFVSTVILPNVALGTTLPTRGRSPAGEVAVLWTVREVFVHARQQCADQSSVKKSSPNEPRYENHSVCCMALSRPIADRKNFISCFLQRAARLCPHARCRKCPKRA